MSNINHIALFKKSLFLVLVSMTMFIVSCEQDTVSNNPAELNNLMVDDNTLDDNYNLEEDAFWEFVDKNRATIDLLAADESLKVFLESLDEMMDEDIRLEAFTNYFENVVLVKYPELAKMNTDDALNILGVSAFQVTETFGLEERGSCHCYSGCHFCCLGYAYGGSVGICFFIYCNRGNGGCRN